MYEWFIPLYDLAVIISSFFYIVKYSFRKRVNRELLERLIVPLKTRLFLRKLKNPVWIHAVSVGEVKSAEPFVRKIKQSYPGKDIVISVVTPQGKEVAEKIYSKDICIFYLPLDVSFIIKRIVKIILPQVLFVMETELWPNLYFFTRKLRAKIVIFNGRISDKSYKYYKLVKGLMPNLFKQVSLVSAQDEDSALRFIGLGMDKSRVKVTGNIKFVNTAVDKERLNLFQEKWREIFGKDNLLIVAGSTHYPEEEIILKHYRDIIRDYPDLSLLLCPRHIERRGRVYRSAGDMGFTPMFISRPFSEMKEEGKRKIFILDTAGELVCFYSLADIVFVGGSIARYGGHNILEPALFSKPVIFGRFMFNFEDIKRKFLESKAAVEITNEDELKGAFLRLIQDNLYRRDLGERAFSVLEKYRNKAMDNFEIIKKFI